MPTLRQLRVIGKPVVFVAALLPLGALVAGAMGAGGATLGANPIEAIQDSTGIWALRFLLLTLGMTPLRLMLGSAWPVQLRRMLGLFAFTYAALHFANYLLLDRALDLREILPDILKRPYITLGFVALLILAALAATSTAAARRRLARRWQQLHRAVYPAAVLVCWHFWWQVKKDVTEPAIYAGILALLLGIRLVDARRNARKAA